MGFMTLLFWLCNVVLLGRFIWFPARFYFVFVSQNFCSDFGQLFCVSPGLFFAPYFGVILLCGI